MRLSAAFLIGLSSVLLISCSWKKKETSPGGPLRVQVPFSIDGDYGLRIVELFSVQNLPELQGLAARFLIDPDSASGVLKGRKPSLRYIRDSDDVIVAKDNLSLQLLTVYSHYEKLKQLDEQSGAGKILQWPQTVAVNVQIHSAEGIVEDNALYSANFDALLLVPYSKESLPLMANGGVLGHEHFHALFQKMVIAPLKEKYPEASHSTPHDSAKLVQALGLDPLPVSSESVDSTQTPEQKLRDHYHAVLMRGINEGLADVWGWVYSGDSAFVGRSLPQEKVHRALDVRMDSFFSKSELYEAVASGESEDVLLFRSYEHGTQLARSIRNFATFYSADNKIPMTEVRLKVAAALIKLLPQMAIEFGQLKDTEFYTLGRAAHLFSEQIDDLNSSQCFYFLKLMPADDRAATAIDQRCEKLKASETGT